MSSETPADTDADFVCYWCEEPLSPIAFSRFTQNHTDWQNARDKAYYESVNFDFNLPEPLPTCDTCDAEIAENQEEMIKERANSKNTNYSALFLLAACAVVALVSNLLFAFFNSFR